MTEKQMERFEGMLTQLVSMVAHLKEDVDMIKEDICDMKTEINSMKTEISSMKTEINGMKNEINGMKAEITNIKETQEKQHVEVMGKLELLRIDHEITWAKTIENERDIERLKKQIVNL